MTIETALYVAIGILFVFGVFDIGFRLGKLQGLKEAQSSSSYRLAVLAGGAKSALERVVSTSGTREQESS